jgi:hypothetical protein
MVADYVVRKGLHPNSSKNTYRVRLSHKVRRWIENDWKRSSTRSMKNGKYEPYLLFGQVYVGQEFVSTMKSRKLQDCPFRLDKYTPEPGSNMPINFKLSFIDEGDTWSTIVEDDFDREDTVLNYKTEPRKKWERVRKHSVSADLNDMPEDFQIGVKLATKTS